MPLINELKRRNVFRVAAAYAVTAWVLIEVSSTLEETLRLPDWADSLLAMFLILGFPVALFLSWAFEVTPEGIKREREIAADAASRKVTARKLDWLVIIMVTLGIALFVADRLLPNQDTGPAQVAATPETNPDDREMQPQPLASEPDRSIAVLPFVNMSTDAEQEYFSDGLTEELLNLLAGVSSLQVAARTSSFFYKDKLDSIRLTDVARELGVAYILEGSVRLGGDKIRITAQLIKADDGFHLWSETYDRKMDDVFAIQDEIAAAVVSELKVKLLGELPHSQVINPKSWELSMQARYLYNRRALGDSDRALELFEQAITLDPENSVAWVGLVPLYEWLFDPPRRKDAIEAGRKAVELDPQNPEAHSRLAGALWRNGDNEEAMQRWQRAVELGEDNVLIQAQLAGYFTQRGDLDSALKHQRKSVRLDPLNIINLSNLSSYLIWADDLAEAEVHALKAIELAPFAPSGYSLLAKIRLLQGNLEEAQELALKFKGQDTDLSGIQHDELQFESLLQYSLGNREQADAALADFEDQFGEDAPMALASIHAWRGEADKAFTVLNDYVQKALDENNSLGIDRTWEPWFDGLHEDPRWEQLLTRWPLPDLL